MLNSLNTFVRIKLDMTSLVGGLNDLKMNQVRMYIRMRIQDVVNVKERQLCLDRIL